MKKTDVPGVGGILSADIAVPEHKRELEFYAAVLTTGNSPLWQQDLLNNLGTPIIGLGERTPEYDKLPLQWMPHIQVDDVAASVERALELGGSEIMHGKDESGKSLWAGLYDPTGAAFGVIPAVDDSDYQVPKNQAYGAITGLSIAVSDAAKLSAFYESVIGWRASPNDKNFEMLIDTQTIVAEIIETDDASRVPAVWILYLPVGDFEASLQKATLHGGEILSQDATQAVIKDPLGVCFAIK